MKLRMVKSADHVLGGRKVTDIGLMMVSEGYKN